MWFLWNRSILAVGNVFIFGDLQVSRELAAKIRKNPRCRQYNEGYFYRIKLVYHIKVIL